MPCRELPGVVIKKRSGRLKEVVGSPAILVAVAWHLALCGREEGEGASYLIG